MLEKLRLTNFRCFEDYEVEFEDFNVIVGRNNTGKSTIIDALKLVSNVRRYAPYRKGLELEPRDIPFSQVNLRYNYRDEESFVHSKFSDTTKVEIVFPLEGRPYANLFRKESAVSGASIREYFGHSIGIVPPVGIFEETEELRDRKYIRSIMVSHLTPRNFRNIWHYFPDGFQEFREIVEETWPGCTIEPPEFLASENRIDMFFRENGITREIFWAGHGFQVWLQLMTFLVKLGQKETIVLDEPDIYLHSDLQKKLVNLCKQRSNQVIIATHAVDIIEEVEPGDIISVDKNSTESCRLSNVDEVQTCITQLGSFQNLKLAHFIRGKSCLFVEGQDFRYLKLLARKLNLESFANEDGFSVVPLQGFSNWKTLKHINWLFKNALGEQIKCYVILDRDYCIDELVEEITTTLQQKGVGAHVWERKEIENYLIHFDALYRMFKNRYSWRHDGARAPLSLTDFKEKLASILEDLRLYTESQMIARRIETRSERSVDPSTVTSQVLAEIRDNWQDLEFRKKVVPGKEFFAKLNAWLGSEYHIAISAGYAANSLRSDEIDGEIAEAIKDFMLSL